VSTNTVEALGDAPVTLSLKEIASWSFGICEGEKPEITASIPALQRGLVWRPHQIELLWDSILRGFPIGVLVVCPKVPSQVRKDDDRGNYHLLDGQQRANAIALGFTDPFPLGEPAGTPSDRPILWLDLKPDLDQSSARSYLVRVTTRAHPWGYTATDAAAPLPISKIRDSLKRIGSDWTNEDYKRPSPNRLWPAAATVPVPLAWLLLAPSDNEEAFWDDLAVRAKANSSSAPWAEAVCRFCADQSASKWKLQILGGIRRASTSKLIVLKAPQELLKVSRQEKTSGAGTEDVTNIEQIFQRLNLQGTPLDPEELSYSMIKAYWPKIADSIDPIAKPRMPQARMVSIAVRAALAHNEDKRGENLPPQPTVSAIRKIAMGRDKTRRNIDNFIAERLENACGLVDRWLQYHPTDNPNGLLPVLVTSIAINSRDVYALLLTFAARMIKDKLDEKELRRWRNPMQVLATVLHWFSEDKKMKAANQVFQHCGSKPTTKTIHEALQRTTETENGHLYRIHSPVKLRDFLKFPRTRFKEWRCSKLIFSGDAKGNAEREKKWTGFLKVIFEQRELLLYSQRHFLAKRFPDYDPARRDLWDEHNRPWDFDHILASAFIQNCRNTNNHAPFRDFSSQWVYTIGNLRACPFEDNRSDQADEARDKIGRSREAESSILSAKDNEQKFLKACEESFLSANEVERFSAGGEVCKDREAAQKFGNTCRQRLLRIYREWYESMGVASLTSKAGRAKTE
jgi:hypothetical protein